MEKHRRNRFSGFTGRNSALAKYVTGIRRSDIPEMAAHADAEANPLYPVPLLMDRLELEHMYEVVAGGMFEDEN